MIGATVLTAELAAIGNWDLSTTVTVDGECVDLVIGAGSCFTVVLVTVTAVDLTWPVFGTEKFAQAEAVVFAGAVGSKGASVFGTEGKFTAVFEAEIGLLVTVTAGSAKLETVVSWLDSDLGSEQANEFGNGARFGFKSAEEKVVKVVALVTEVTRSSMKISSFESWPESSLSKGLKSIIPPVDNFIPKRSRSGKATESDS